MSAEESQLHSELAQLCLPASQRDRNQRLAWVNSVCLAYLVIGMIGLKAPAPVTHAVQPLDIPVMMPIETPPPATPAAAPPEEMAEEPPEQTDAPALVAVVLPTPDLAFPVPTVGNVLVPGAMATAPPLKPMEAPAPQATNRIYNIGLTDRRGARPPPDYPQEYVRARMTGTVILLIHVDASGVITQVEVEKSTGHPRLDEHTVKHVKRRFTFPAAEGPRVYQLPVGYEL